MLAPVAVLGLTACRSNLLEERHAAKPGTGLAARVHVLEGTDCGAAKASVLTLPTHCAWPADEQRSFLLSATVQVVAHVGPDGRADGARVVGGPSGHEFDAAAVRCALDAEYKPLHDESGAATEGETCAVSFRLDRYPTDVNPSNPPQIACPGVPGYNYTSAQTGGGCTL